MIVLPAGAIAGDASAPLTLRAVMVASCLLDGAHLDFGQVRPAAAASGSVRLPYACTNGSAATLSPAAGVIQLTGRSHPDQSVTVNLSSVHVVGAGAAATLDLPAKVLAPQGAAPDVYEGAVTVALTPDDENGVLQEAQIQITATVTG